MMPRISLITPSFQQQGYLADCLASVHDQGYPELEHIVVDGGSTDGSKEQIERYADKLAWWCSTPDNGQSHAINKGLAHATGDVFGWLNSDDLLLPGALHEVGNAFAADPGLLVFGGRRIIRSAEGTDSVSGLDDASRPDDLFTDPMVNQQSTFYRMDAVRSVGGVDEVLHYAMDLELWWRILFKYGTAAMRFVPVDLAVFRLHDESKTVKEQHAFQTETAAILKRALLHLDQEDLFDVLDQGYPGAIATRAIHLRQEHVPIIRRMVVHFLLKWNHVIHDKRQFDLMRTFRRSIPLDRDPLDALYRDRLERLDRQLQAPGWLAFRIKRKFDHLLP